MKTGSGDMRVRIGGAVWSLRGLQLPVDHEMSERARRLRQRIQRAMKGLGQRD